MSLAIERSKKEQSERSASNSKFHNLEIQWALVNFHLGKGWPDRSQWTSRNQAACAHHLRNIHQPVANGIDNQLRRLMDAQGIHNIGAMNGNGISTQVKLARDLFV